MIVKIMIMYCLTALISFFVAFLIKVIYYAINIFNENKKKKHVQFEKYMAAHEILEIQKQAGPLTREGEIYATIAMALYLFTEEKNEQEKLEITIKKTIKPYSPWNSKIYGIRQHPR